MIEIDTVGGLGNITGDTQQYRGHPPEYWAQKATERICGISENAAPHIKHQAQAFRLSIYNTILYYIKQSINSERCTMKNILAKQGHEDLANILTEIK